MNDKCTAQVKSRQQLKQESRCVLEMNQRRRDSASNLWKQKEWWVSERVKGGLGE
jgi:hypothetical protein